MSPEDLAFIKGEIDGKISGGLKQLEAYRERFVKEIGELQGAAADQLASLTEKHQALTQISTVKLQQAVNSPAYQESQRGSALIPILLVAGVAIYFWRK